MTKTLPLLAIAACMLLASCGDNMGSGGGNATLEKQIDSVSYILGFDMGKKTRPDSIKLDMDAFAQGYMKGYASDSGLISDSMMQVVMNNLQTQIMVKRTAAMSRDSAENEKAAATFLVENKSKTGVIEIPSGLQYQIITPGTGPKPTANDQVMVLYKGMLLDGTVFDSSMDRSKPAQFPVMGVIPGWSEVLQLMPKGSKWKIFIPGKLAYGMNPPPGGKIEPMSMLIFEVELLDIAPPQAPPSGANGGNQGMPAPQGGGSGMPPGHP